MEKIASILNYTGTPSDKRWGPLGTSAQIPSVLTSLWLVADLRWMWREQEYLSQCCDLRLSSGPIYA